MSVIRTFARSMQEHLLELKWSEQLPAKPATTETTTFAIPTLCPFASRCASSGTKTIENGQLTIENDGYRTYI